MAQHWDATRPGEIEGGDATRADATLVFIGRIRTPYKTRDECPRQGDLAGPPCRLEIEPQWRPAMLGLETCAHLQVLYWMHRARRDLLVLSPRADAAPRGAFALRAPVRPNPIASSLVKVVAVEDGVVVVRGLDCLDGTPLLDIKVWRDGLPPAREQETC
jgi:tRNA-Thr(GGU) m(6)t(6)A37 methyltransferase TsaA